MLYWKRCRGPSVVHLQAQTGEARACALLWAGPRCHLTSRARCHMSQEASGGQRWRSPGLKWRGRRSGAGGPGRSSGPRLGSPSACMACSLCCTCCDITLLMPMRLSVITLDVWARLSLVVFLKAQRREECQLNRPQESPMFKRGPNSPPVTLVGISHDQSVPARVCVETGLVQTVTVRQGQNRWCRWQSSCSSHQGLGHAPP